MPLLIVLLQIFHHRKTLLCAFLTHPIVQNHLNFIQIILSLLYGLNSTFGFRIKRFNHSRYLSTHALTIAFILLICILKKHLYQITIWCSKIFFHSNNVCQSALRNLRHCSIEARTVCIALKKLYKSLLLFVTLVV